MSRNVTAGKRANFYCNHSSSSSIGWRVNESSLSVLDLQTITSITFHDPDGSVSSILTIEALEEYNQSTVECVALHEDAPSDFSPPVKLLIQGTQLNNIASLPCLLISLNLKDH